MRVPFVDFDSRHEPLRAELDAAVAAVGRRGDFIHAAQAHGAKYRGRRVGTFGHAAAFSFDPSKNLGAWEGFRFTCRRPLRRSDTVAATSR